MTQTLRLLTRDSVERSKQYHGVNLVSFLESQWLNWSHGQRLWDYGIGEEETDKIVGASMSEG